MFSSLITCPVPMRDQLNGSFILTHLKSTWFISKRVDRFHLCFSSTDSRAPYNPSSKLSISLSTFLWLSVLQRAERSLNGLMTTNIIVIINSAVTRPQHLIFCSGVPICYLHVAISQVGNNVAWFAFHDGRSSRVSHLASSSSLLRSEPVQYLYR